MTMNKQAYDDFSLDYDKFVNWESRLGFELPFIEAQIERLGSDVRVLDAACGTGMHAIALAQRGIKVAGADLSDGMVERARKNAALANQEIRFEPVGFGELAKIFGKGSFDVVLCLGNSLPHILSLEELVRALTDFANCLRSGGKLIIQNRNFDAVMERKERWMEPQSYREEEREWLFLRFYDYIADGTIDFNIVTLRREQHRGWQQVVTSTRLRPILQADLEIALEKAGFEAIQTYGDLSGTVFDRSNSGNLVVTAIRKRRQA